jgi:hypothetical protein
MTKRHAISFLLLAVVSFVGAGCNKKKQAKAVPVAPSITELARLAPLPPIVILVMQPEVLPPSTTTATAPSPATQKKPKRNGRKPNGNSNGNSNGAASPPPVQTAQNTSPSARITIDRPPVAEGSGGVGVGLERSDEAHQNQTTAQLLQSTEANLKSLTRSLDAEEQATVSQIRNFIAQSRTAIAENDLVRARNLALKAHLLCDELVRH